MYWAQLTLDAGLTGKCCKNAIFILSPWNSQKVETVDLPLGRVGFMIETFPLRSGDFTCMVLVVYDILILLCCFKEDL